MAKKSYFDKDIQVSLEIPADWDAVSTEQFPLVLMAPARSDFRANMSFSVRSLNPATPENLQRIIQSTRADREATYNGFELVAEDRLFLDNFPAHVEQYRWNNDDTGIPLTQIFALILTGPDALYGIHGTTLRSLETVYVPVFQEVIASLRFVKSD